jgi:hypothetical protein
MVLVRCVKAYAIPSAWLKTDYNMEYIIQKSQK